MTYQPDMGYPQQPHHNPSPPPGGGGWSPHQPGPYWTAPPPQPQPPQRQRRAVVVAIVIAVLVVLGGATAIVLSTSGGGGSTPVAGHASSPPALPTGSQPQHPAEGAPSSGRPLPPPTPTGQPYDDNDPAIGSCVDLARRPTGVIIYQADCNDPAANLTLDNIQAEECPAAGFYGLKSLSNKILCFTYNLQAGDCLDMNIPRRAACNDATALTGVKPKVTVTDIHPGQQDGTGCALPQLFVQVGKETSRGIACLAPTSQQTATTAISR